MARKFYFFMVILGISYVLIGLRVWPGVWWPLCLFVPYTLVGLYDIIEKKHNILRIYPVTGHLRYFFESIRTEIQQYFINNNQSGKPFSREVRSLVYQRAKNVNDTLPFGTQQEINQSGYDFAYHSQRTQTPPESEKRIGFGGKDCKQPYHASRLNISAMSFGAISSNAIRALNAGAKLGDFAHNTGEGGISTYHLENEGDLIWQIGTGYFGCRDANGRFDAGKFAERASLPSVKMIELKLSQGAKPSHGGVLPAAKVSEEIATIRGVEVGKEVLSPPMHSAFSSPTGCMEFIAKLRELSAGKPIGLKFCVGYRHEVMVLIKAMLKTGIMPDFIAIDGAEGGTGAAPLEMSNRLGMPIDEGLNWVHQCLRGAGIRDQLRLIASGKVVTSFDMISKFALGADSCNAARSMMFALGCVQSLRCHLNTCPTGVTSQDPARVQGLVVSDKRLRVYHYHRNTMNTLLEMLGAMGIAAITELTPHHVYKRVGKGASQTFAECYEQIEHNALIHHTAPERTYQQLWERVTADNFQLANGHIHA